MEEKVNKEKKRQKTVSGFWDGPTSSSQGVLSLLFPESVFISCVWFDCREKIVRRQGMFNSIEIISSFEIIFLGFLLFIFADWMNFLIHLNAEKK